MAEILGAYPSHAILAGDQAPPTVLGEQPHPKVTDRPPAVNLDRWFYLPGDTAGVLVSDRLLGLLRR